MKISTITRYGLRALIYIANEYSKDNNKYIFVKEIASSEKISPAYLEQIMIRLSAGGLVISSRGRKGGFKLSKPPSEIKLIDIIKSLEGSLAPSPCVDSEEYCDRVDDCKAHIIWKNVKKVLEDFFSSYTLEDLIKNGKLLKNL